MRFLTPPKKGVRNDGGALQLVSGNTFTLIYTITEEDYNSSVECE